MTKSPLIIAIADDFSGAAEIAGIGHSFGLKTSIFTKENIEQLSEFSVFCSNTREKTEREAIEILEHLLDTIKPFSENVYFFKKIDSVFRGHIIAEDQVVKNKLNFKRSFLLAAIPSLNRRIINGIYFIGKYPLDETPFAWDPNYPRNTANVVDLLDKNTMVISRGKTAPGTGTFIFDQETTKDLDAIIELVNPDQDLICGSGDAFRSFLNHLSIKDKGGSVDSWKSVEYALFIDGSTSAMQKDFIRKLPNIYLGQGINDVFLGNKSVQELAREYLQNVKEKKMLYLQIGNCKMAKGIDSHDIEQILGKLAKEMVHCIRQPLDLFLTGGATAYAVISQFGLTHFKVEAQLSSGIVSLTTLEAPFRIIVKPGSYLWPAKLVNI